MVEQRTKQVAIWANELIDKEIKIAANKFVTQNAGKLRDYYRIGKMLGSGKDRVVDWTRCFRRGENVCAQRNRSLESSQGSEEIAHGRWREENAF